MLMFEQVIESIQTQAMVQKWMQIKNLCLILKWYKENTQGTSTGHGYGHGYNNAKLLYTYPYP